jgi:serine protease Do
MSRKIGTLGLVAAAGVAGAILGATSSGQLRGAERTPTAPVVSSPPLPAAGGTLGMDTFQEIARKDNAAVVNISTSKVVHEAHGHDQFFDFFGHGLSPFLGPWSGGGGDETLTQRSLGSGFVVDPKGFILTNRHVVDGADEVTVTLNDSHHYKAKIVGQDARTDIALLRIEPHETLTALPLGDSDTVEPGEWVMAIGNPFGLGGNSVTVGVISYKGRSFDLSTRGTPIEMLQTDAAINPGNSGGPLIDARGQAVGINTLIMTGGAQQYSGVGFAVPINVAREILPQLREKGHVVRGWLGVQIQGVDEDLAKSLKLKEARGAVVTDVTDGSPAEKAGLKPGDVVLSVDGHAVEDSADLAHRIATKGPDTTVDLDVLRDGSEKTLSVALGTFPESTEAAESGSGETLGLTIHSLTPDLAQSLGIDSSAHGVVVMRVEPGSQADSAGLQERDVILSVDGHPVDDVGSFQSAVEKARPAGLMRLRVRRGNGYYFIVVKTS